MTKEYHIDGFRFDLMAIHDVETMNRVSAEVRAINPYAVIYGEDGQQATARCPLNVVR